MARSQAGGGRRVDWFAAGVGLVVAVAVQLVGGTLLFGSNRPALVSQGLLTGALGPLGRFGSAGLDTLGLVVDDVLVLSGGTLGGLIAGAVRNRRPPANR
ncbi:MAG: hypothetical protein E6I88_02900 [Chloroflexi bacterium]|nr:MAG: hypothetical protein E6I88_02900 [Chloroflexota bacterium]